MQLCTSNHNQLRGKIKDFVLSVRQNVQNKFIDETLSIRPNVIKFSHLTTTVFAFYKDIISDGLSSMSFTLYIQLPLLLSLLKIYLFFQICISDSIDKYI